MELLKTISGFQRSRILCRKHVLLRKHSLIEIGLLWRRYSTFNRVCSLVVTIQCETEIYCRQFHTDDFVRGVMNVHLTEIYPNIKTPRRAQRDRVDSFSYRTQGGRQWITISHFPSPWPWRHCCFSMSDGVAFTCWLLPQWAKGTCDRRGEGVMISSL